MLNHGIHWLLDDVSDYAAHPRHVGHPLVGATVECERDTDLGHLS